MLIDLYFKTNKTMKSICINNTALPVVSLTVKEQCRLEQCCDIYFFQKNYIKFIG